MSMVNCKGFCYVYEVVRGYFGIDVVLKCFNEFIENYFVKNGVD